MQWLSILRPSGLAVLGLFIIPAAQSDAQDFQLTAGIATVEITPDVELINWVNKEPYGQVLDPLFVRALVLSDGQNRVALVALDLVECRDAFTERLRSSCVDVVRQADAARKPAAVGLSHAWAGEVVFNRRPIAADGTVHSTLVPADPYALPESQRFGPVNATLTWLSIRDEHNKPLAAVFHLPAHAVSVYGENAGLSADWPGAVIRRLKTQLGIETLFLQGCAGDIVPWRRGIAHSEAMGQLVAERAMAAEVNWNALPAAQFVAKSASVELPCSELARSQIQQPNKRVEIQVIAFGSLAIVGLPGEPLTKIGTAIQERSPFAQTIVLGYSNGSGVQYIGVPGEKAKGGYEMGEWGLGSDEAGGILIDSACELLSEVHVLADAADRSSSR